MLVDLRILRAPKLNLSTSLATLYARIPIKTRNWVVECLSGSSLLPSNFEGLANLLKQAAVSSVDAGAAWANLLEVRQGYEKLAQHVERFCALTNLAGAPESTRARLFCASLPVACQSILGLMPSGVSLAKEVEAA